MVYTGGGIERVISSFGTLLIAASQSRQSTTAALLITSFAHALPLLRSPHDHDELMRSLNAALPSVTQQAESPALVDALEELVNALATAVRASRTVQQVQAILRAATEHLIPDPSTLDGRQPLGAAPSRTYHRVHRTTPTAKQTRSLGR